MLIHKLWIETLQFLTALPTRQDGVENQRLDGFERTLSVLSSRLHVSYWSEVQLLLDLDPLLFIVSQQRQHCEDSSYFALHAEEEEQLSSARVGVVRSGVPGRRSLNISEDLLEVLCKGAGFCWAADSSGVSPRYIFIYLKTTRHASNKKVLSP